MASKSNEPQPLQGERARVIFRVAARIFRQKGYHATSMDDLAQALKLTKAGLYYYIESKEDLLYRIMAHGLDRLEKEVIEPARAEPDPERRLETIIQLHAAELLASGGDIPTLSDEIAALTPKHRRRILRRKRHYFDLVRDTLDALKARGQLRDIDTTVATFSLFGMLLWLPRWCKNPGRLSGPEVIEQLRHIVWGGLLNSRP